MSTEKSPIPLVDFDGLVDGTPERRQEIGDQFYKACHEVGFAYIVNHGIPQKKIDGMFDYSRRFFDLPLETKRSILHPADASQSRGYSETGVEQVWKMYHNEEEFRELRRKNAREYYPDCKESFDVGKSPCLGLLFRAFMKNIWLEDRHLAGLRPFSTDFFMNECRPLQMRALHALTLGMPNVSEHAFEEYHSYADNEMRLAHYPSRPWEEF
ncbi:MAG: hypothetical protein TREMPRED_005482, partial [Tremellales sp. Tagirdzhanova-0007]